MTNAHRFLQNLLVFGSVVPLAIFLGYLIVAPPDMTTYGTFALVFLVLTFPLILRWHHPLLILSWNMGMVLPLRGSPQLWFAVAILSLGVVIVRRTLGRGFRLQSVPSLTAPLIFITGVVVLTGLVRGGLNLGSFGGSVGGGKRNLLIFAAVIGYFALASQKIPEITARRTVALFFLSGITYFIGYLVPYIPQSFFFLFSFFPPETLGLEMVGAEILRVETGMTRTFALTFGFLSIMKAMLAYYGLRRVINLHKPWLTAVFLAAAVLALWGGFRGAFLVILLTLAFLFVTEGLLRTRIFAATIVAIALVSLLGLVYVKELPLSIQRTLTVLPIDVDPAAELDAQHSTEWRLRIWRVMYPLVPQYFWLGKGYAINMPELQTAETLLREGRSDSVEVALLSGDYHSGPLSIIIPLGVLGVIGAIWLFAAGMRVLWLNYKWSPLQLKEANGMLFVSFVVQTFLFLGVFGSFFSDLALFTGLLGLSVSINGGVRRGAPSSLTASIPQQAVASPALLPAPASHSSGAA